MTWCHLQKLCGNSNLIPPRVKFVHYLHFFFFGKRLWTNKCSMIILKSPQYAIWMRFSYYIVSPIPAVNCFHISPFLVLIHTMSSVGGLILKLRPELHSLHKWYYISSACKENHNTHFTFQTDVVMIRHNKGCSNQNFWDLSPITENSICRCEHRLFIGNLFK